jgi:flagellar basal body rod protein FlgC
MDSVLNTAVSGLQVSRLRMSAAANNVANAQTDGFRRDQVRQEARPASSGVTARVDKSPQPGADLIQDMVDQQSATYAFKANWQVVKAADDMIGRWLDVRA